MADVELAKRLEVHVQALKKNYPEFAEELGKHLNEWRKEEGELGHKYHEWVTSLARDNTSNFFKKYSHLLSQIQDEYFESATKPAEEKQESQSTSKEEDKHTSHRQSHVTKAEHGPLPSPKEDNKSTEQVVVSAPDIGSSAIEIPQENEEATESSENFSGTDNIDGGNYEYGDGPLEPSEGEEVPSSGSDERSNPIQDINQLRSDIDNVRSGADKLNNLFGGGEGAGGAEGAGTASETAGAAGAENAGLGGTGLGADASATGLSGAGGTSAAGALGEAGAGVAGAGSAATAGTAAGAGGATVGGTLGGILAAIAPVLIVVGVFVIIILIFALIFYFLGLGGNPVLPQVQVTCGEVTDYPPLLKGDNFDKSINDLMSKHYGLLYGTTDYNNTTITQTTKTKDGTTVMDLVSQNLPWIINDTCLLFGHVQAQTTNNTFGKYVTGADAKKNITPYQVQINLVYDDTDPCRYVLFDPIDNPSYPKITINYINPNLCDANRFQFLVGQSLARAMIVQQTHLNDPQSVLNKFENSNMFLVNPLVTLPTRDCQAQDPGFPDYFHWCFADMVGEYFTYPFYLNTYIYIPPPVCTSVSGAYCSLQTSPQNGYHQDSSYLCPQSTGPHPYYCYVPNQPPSCTTVSGAYCSTNPLPKPNYSVSGAYSCPPTNNRSTNYCFIPITPTAVPSAALVLSDFPTGKYDGYYQFAKYNLFDSVELYMTQQQSGAPICPNPLSSSASATDIINAIHTLYGFNTTIDTAKGVDKVKVLGIAYDTLCKLYISKNFVRLIKTLNPDGTVNGSGVAFNIHSGACGTGYDAGVHIDVNYCTTSDDAFRFVITHELGHQLENRNPALETSFDTTVFSKDGRQLPTDNCQCAYPEMSSRQCGKGVFGTNPAHECFADMVGEYLVFQTYEHTQTTNNKAVTFSQYPSSFPDWYGFARDQIFKMEYVNKGSNSYVVKVAMDLANDIIAACPLTPAASYTYVTLKNYNCLERLRTKYGTYGGTNIVDFLKESVTTYGKLECVAFARAVSYIIQMPLTKTPAGTASSYAGSKQLGYTWIPVATISKQGVKPGDIAIFYNGLNHIAIVTSIIGDGTRKFDVAEANGGSGKVDITTGGNYNVDNNFAGVFRLQ